MKYIDIEKTNRKNTYEWFKSFRNSTYGANVDIDITKVVHLSKQRRQSFYANMLYLVMKALNSVDEMKMRLVDNKPILFDKVNAAITIMTDSGNFENGRIKYNENYLTFYDECRKVIETTKCHTNESEVKYNPDNIYDEIYLTCLPWISYTSMSHPIPDNQASQCIPRICWGKYFSREDRILVNLNITVSHIFVDGLPLSNAFNKIQEFCNNAENLLKI